MLVKCKHIDLNLFPEKYMIRDLPPNQQNLCGLAVQLLINSSNVLDFSLLTEVKNEVYVLPFFKHNILSKAGV